MGEVIMLDIASYVQEYNELRKQESLLKKRKDELAKLIKDHASNHGTKDSTGSAYCESDRFIFGSQVRKSVKLNHDKAREFLVPLGLYEKVVEMKEVVNEDKIEQLIIDGELTDEDLEQMVDIKTTYSVSVTERQVEEEMPEITVENSVKKRKLLKKKVG